MTAAPVNDRGLFAVAGATGGLVLTVIGMLLPWSRIGGRNRSGFETADVAFALADGGLPDLVEWIGRFWYGPAALLLVVWALVFLAGTGLVRTVGVVLTLLAIVMWGVFAWAGGHYGIFTTRWLGPMVSVAGACIIGGFGLLSRRSVLSQ